VLGGLVDHIRPALEAAGDLERVEDGVERVLRGGGATQQRAAYERLGSVEGVVDDLIERTETTWR
jgi:carboxylate-amine ligase